MKDKTKQAYSEILTVLTKHKDLCVFDIDDLKDKSEKHLFGLELKETHGLNLDPKRINSIDWNRFGDYMSIGRWGKKYNRIISWPVDGRQPKDEILLQINFPTGAYIFGGSSYSNKDFPIEFFEKFWNELKSYKPDYIDDINKGVYWNIKNAKDIFNSFNSILTNYYDLNKEDAKRRKIKKMKDDLLKLENE